MKTNVKLILISLVVLILAAACGSNKKEPVVVAPRRNPLMLAQDASSNGMKAFTDKSYVEAITNFGEAVDLYNEAAITAALTDSIPQNIEKMNLNIATTHIRMAEESLEDQIFVEAVAHYDSALVIYKSLAPLTKTKAELDSEILALYKNLAVANEKAGNFETAITNINQILAVNPGDEDMLNYKFTILNNDIKDETRAFKVLQDYAEASDDPTAYRMLADKFNDKGNKVKAGEYYEKALALKQDANTYSAVANFYRSNDQWAKSNEVLSKLVAINPDQATLLTAYRLMGDNYNKLNNKAKMAEYFEKALNIESDEKIALLLASYYNGLKNYNKVITYSTIVLRTNGSSSDALMLRGLAYYNLKRNAEAKADLTRIQNDPKYGKQVQSLLKAIK